MKDAGISDRVKRGAEVILKSCSTGETQSNQENMANFVAALFPQANVYAPIDPDNNMEQVNAKGKLVGPGYDNGAFYTYHVRPEAKKKPPT